MLRNRHTSIWARSAPYACAALLCGLLVAGGISAPRPQGATEYRARVRSALDAIPYKIGPAVGVDAEPTAAAVKLLTPNKILERHYVDPSNGASFSLLIVHCADVRDMLGHFPPVCYPAHGWTTSHTEQTGLDIPGEASNAMTYSFTRTDELFQHQMSVLNFFVLPESGPTIFADMTAVEKASRSSEIGGLGVAQVQIVMGEGVSPQWRAQVLSETLQAIAPALRVIGEGIKK